MKITNLTKSFGNKEIFKSRSFEFPLGHVTYLMGESGKGKTTLLRIIAGLDTDFEGNITSCDKIAYVFQEPRLFPTLSVLENIKIVNDCPNVDVYELLSILELNGCEKLQISELSGGMKSRVSIARAIYFNADIVLMDEPFASLDAQMKSRIIPQILDLLKEKTVIIVSHDLLEAQKYSDCIIEI